jgi:hypothetical protein
VTIINPRLVQIVIFFIYFLFEKSFVNFRFVFLQNLVFVEILLDFEILNEIIIKINYFRFR